MLVIQAETSAGRRPYEQFAIAQVEKHEKILRHTEPRLDGACTDWAE